ncbi:MAG: hypothetical protein LQ348_003865 [Seirophora lacunosa]|nr:MAG: hypothetical protein LQ348_003865 [Seirophora lacunosa]
MADGERASSPFVILEDEVLLWAAFLRKGLDLLYRGELVDGRFDDAPRRKSHKPEEARMAEQIAQMIYPNASESSLPALIKYEKDMLAGRRAYKIQESQHAFELQQQFRDTQTWREKVALQGPWDEINDPLPLTGASALPMPVDVSDRETLKPFFDHLSNGGGYRVDEYGQETEEPYYGIKVGEWEKGMLYQDGRMDLCKMVVGPPNIGILMENLKNNTFVRHFLLGNNIIGPAGAKAIARYLVQRPNQIETWYLAGNCIDSDNLNLVVDGWNASSTITNIWLKRNPLGPSSIPVLTKLITQTPNLRTLDLDQTELSDAGVAQLFVSLADFNQHGLPLRHIYLNATGISVAACRSLARYLATTNCSLQSLYISNNPIGEEGARALANGLSRNSSLIRLMARSCGLKSVGATAIMDALLSSPKIMALDIGLNFATQDLGSRYNHFDDEIQDTVINFIEKNKSLRFLDLGVTAMTLSAVEKIADALSESPTLVVFRVESTDFKLPRPLKRQIRALLARNVKGMYGDGATYEDFAAEEQRWLISPKDVRLIDSGYRNRDMELARRGEKILDKWWRDENELEHVMKGGSRRNDGTTTS